MAWTLPRYHATTLLTPHQQHLPVLQSSQVAGMTHKPSPLPPIQRDMGAALDPSLALVPLKTIPTNLIAMHPRQF